MKQLFGVYAYNIPDRITHGIDGVELAQITEDRASYKGFPYAGQVNVLIARQGVVHDMLDVFPNVKWLQLLNSGYEKLDLSVLKERNILFTNARSVYCSTIAEDVIAKILILSRNYTRHFADQQRCFWPDDDQLPNFNLDLEGKTLGILGAGAIGREIAIRAKVFGLKIHGYDPYLMEQEGFDVIYNRSGGLEQLLQESDYVITSLPVTEETRDIINLQTLSMMKPSAYLINVARGAIIREEDLIEALNRGLIAGAYLDVAKKEPLPTDDPLWQAKNIHITPHRAAYGDQMHRKMCALIERNIKHYMAGEPLEDQIL